MKDKAKIIKLLENAYVNGYLCESPPSEEMINNYIESKESKILALSLPREALKEDILCPYCGCNKYVQDADLPNKCVNCDKYFTELDKQPLTKPCKTCIWYNSDDISAPCQACFGRNRHVLIKQSLAEPQAPNDLWEEACIADAENKDKPQELSDEEIAKKVHEHLYDTEYTKQFAHMYGTAKAWMKAIKWYRDNKH